MSRLWLIVVVAIAATTGLLHFPSQSGQTAHDDTQLFHEQWQSFHIAHYRYSLVVASQCGLMHQPYTMEVRDGQLISAVNSAGQPISDADIDAPSHSVDWFFSLTSFDSLFDHIHQISSQASTVNVVHDPDYAFPAYTFVNWKTGRPGAKVALNVLDFQVLR